MINIGYTFHAKKPGRTLEHLFIVIAIFNENVDALFVNVTTRKDSSDTSCILNVGDHNYITHESIINYANARITKIVLLEEAIRKDYFSINLPASIDLLEKIHKGALNSKFLPEEMKQYIPT